MPQIRCPNCGTSINLETRRKIDLSLILNSLRSGPKTFTQLLRATRLPRKTLNLRLKELVNSEAIVKDGGYRLNGALPSSWWRKTNLKQNLQFSRKKIIMMLLTFSLGILLAQAYGKYMIAPPPKPTITETFNVDIIISGVPNLYAWQINVVFDPNVLIVTNVVEGPFLQGVDNSVTTLFIARTHIVDGIFVGNDVNDPFTIINDDKTSIDSVLMGCCLLGDASGVSGRGTLATVTFGVIGEGSHELQLEDVKMRACIDGSIVEIQSYELEVQQD